MMPVLIMEHTNASKQTSLINPKSFGNFKFIYKEFDTSFISMPNKYKYVLDI